MRKKANLGPINTIVRTSLLFVLKLKQQAQIQPNPQINFTFHSPPKTFFCKFSVFTTPRPHPSRIPKSQISKFQNLPLVPSSLVIKKRGKILYIFDFLSHQKKFKNKNTEICLLPPNSKLQNHNQINQNTLGAYPTTINKHSSQTHLFQNHFVNIVLLPLGSLSLIPTSMEANKENIIVPLPCLQKPIYPFLPIPPSSKKPIKRKLRKPLADITNLFQPTHALQYYCLFLASVSVYAANNSRKRKGFGGESDIPVQVTCSKSLRMGFR